MENNELKDNLSPKRIIITYVLICTILFLLSFLSILFNEWVLPLCTLTCSIFGTFVVLLLLKTHQSIVPEGGKGIFVVYMLLRYLCMIIGIVISCLIIKFTMGENYVKTRYLMVVIAAIPYMVTFVPWLINKNN